MACFGRLLLCALLNLQLMPSRVAGTSTCWKSYAYADASQVSSQSPRRLHLSTRFSKASLDPPQSFLLFFYFGRNRMDAVLRELQTENAVLRAKLSEHGIAHPDTMPSSVTAASIGASIGASTGTERRLDFGQSGNVVNPHRYPNPNLGQAGHASAVASPSSAAEVEPPTFPERPSFASVPPADEPEDAPPAADDAGPATLSRVPHLSTQLVLFDGCPNDPYHPSSMPIYQTATFVQPNVSEFGPYDYCRSGNPTRTALETSIGKLEGAFAAFAFTSGMAALHAVLSTLKPGEKVVASADLYGGMHRLLTDAVSHQGLEVSFVDTTDLASVRSALAPAASGASPKLVHLESPSNPLLRITDLHEIARLAHECGALVSVDCTMMTPLRQRPLRLGCDLVIHSGTKFFSGHSDTMSGFVAVRSEALAKRIGFIQNAQGTALGPFDCWLLLRGLKTLSLRLERQESNAVAVAEFLCRRSALDGVIKKVHYTGVDPARNFAAGVLSISPAQYLLHRTQASGPGTVVSFETGDVQVSRRFVDACRLFKLTVSFGSCNSLVEMPCLLSHASIPKERRTLPEDLVRLSVGVEHIADILADLCAALMQAMSMST